MAEYALQRPQRGWLDWIRDLATIGGSAVLADPSGQGRPGGAALQALAYTIAQHQDRAPQAALSGAMQDVYSGKAGLPEVFQALAQKGYLNDQSRELLRQQMENRVFDPVMFDTWNRLMQTGQGPTGTNPAMGLSPSDPSFVGPPPPPELTQGAAPMAIEPGTGMEMAQPAAIPPVPAPPPLPSAVAPQGALLQAPASGLGVPTPEQLSRNIEGFLDNPMGLAQLAIAAPKIYDAVNAQRNYELGMGRLKNRQDIMDRRQIAEERLQREQDARFAGRMAASQLFGSVWNGDPPQESAGFAKTALQFGYDDDFVQDLMNPAKNLSAELKERMQLMGMNPNSPHQMEAMQAAYNANKRAKTEAAYREREAALRAKYDFDMASPIYKDAKFFVDISTLRRPDPNTLRGDLMQNPNIIMMDEKSLNDARTNKDLQNELEKMKILVLGGTVTPDLAKMLQVAPGTVLPPIVGKPGSEQAGAWERLWSGGKAVLNRFMQTPEGARLRVYNTIARRYGVRVERAVGNVGNFTEQDMVLARDVLPFASPQDILSMHAKGVDLYDTAVALFENQRQTLQEKDNWIYGNNLYSDFNSPYTGGVGGPTAPEQPDSTYMPPSMPPLAPRQRPQQQRPQQRPQPQTPRPPPAQITQPTAPPPVTNLPPAPPPGGSTGATPATKATPPAKGDEATQRLNNILQILQGTKPLGQ